LRPGEFAPASLMREWSNPWPEDAAPACSGILLPWRHGCAGPGKCPACRWRNVRFPSSDEDAERFVRRYWNPEAGERGFALHLGKSHLVALDVDERHGGLESLSQLMQDFPLPDTWRDDRLRAGVSLSPHLYFQEPVGWAALRLPSAIRLFSYPGLE